MKKRMIQMLVIFLMVCLTTSSKQNSQGSTANSCRTMCMQETGGDTKEAAEESILSPINLFMIHAQ
ncbi:MAG: hypothetical protein HYR66_19205 [Sphingobacteriales bacterium]|nr:hypothetical protein [Sphingobacteriales bacterium]MBI3717187.1 hypothetical protein [Sphingobacteriales bacterium]